MQQKVLTVTIPTWNRAKLLKELLSELIAQIISDNLQDKIELLISNNGSGDETELLVLALKAKHEFISYNNNGINKGARYNVLKCMELASAKYLILFGDDDRLKPASLKKVVQFLEANPSTGNLYDSHLFKRNPFGDAVVTLTQLAANFFYYLGNAGLFIVKSDYVKDVLKQHTYDFFSPTWPQTQIFILASEQNKNDEIRICDLDILSAGKHEEVMIYTSYYLWRTTYHDLVDAALSIKDEISYETLQASTSYFKNNVTQNFFNILQCGVFLDDKETRNKTSRHIFQNLYKFSLKERIFLTIAAITLILPVFLTRMVSDIFISLTKGKPGVEKKNDFVNKERKKRLNKLSASTNAIREFDFKNV